jgi:hypothetical protein
VTTSITPEELALWQRRLASQANNKAWALAEATNRTSDEDEEMLHAAHAATHFWRLIGDASNHAHSFQLLAHVYALLGLPEPAKHYLLKSQPFFLERDAALWERAFAHAVAANVSAAAGEQEAHRIHYHQAELDIAALEDEEDRKILNATMRVIPVPDPRGAA